MAVGEGPILSKELAPCRRDRRNRERNDEESANGRKRPGKGIAFLAKGTFQGNPVAERGKGKGRHAVFLTSQGETSRNRLTLNRYYKSMDVRGGGVFLQRKCHTKTQSRKKKTKGRKVWRRTNARTKKLVLQEKEAWSSPQ